MKYHFLLLPLAFFVSLMPLPASALDNQNDAMAQRVDRLEHDIMLLQKQLANAPAGSLPVAGGGGTIDNAAQLKVLLSAIEEELRNLRGRIEQNEFQMKKVSDNFDKLQKDVDYRFSELSKAPANAPDTTPDGAAPEKTSEKAHPEKAPKAPLVEEDKSGQTSGGDGQLHAPEENAGSTPRDLYNAAFRLLNETKYEEAAAQFDKFTKKYPKDPLVGNAYYWEGETFYIRRDYVNAADNFRQGFEALPEGPKAADNLLKLSMSLDALNRDKEACVVLGQITTKFKRSSTSVTEKAISEQKRIGCQ